MITAPGSTAQRPQPFWLQGEISRDPVRFDEHRRLWHVYGHPEALEVLTTPAAFASNTVRLFPGEVDRSFEESNLVHMDGAEHAKLRRLVRHVFTARLVAELTPRIETVADALLDDLIDRTRFDLVTDFAYPLPVIVIAELLGIPADDRHLFKQWVFRLFENKTEISRTDDDGRQAEAFRTQAETIRELSRYLCGHITERRRRPRNDLLTLLVEAEVDGDRLTDNEVANFANLLLVAGHITTTMLLGNTVLCLGTFPDQAAQVRSDRTLVPSAIEESLRYLSPFAATARATTTPVTIGDRAIPPDQLVMIWLGAANRDRRVFHEPARFDVRRHPNAHLGFGHGVHFCLGAPLARLEGRIALNMLLDRFSTLHTDPGNPPGFLPTPDMTGVISLPLRTD